MAFPRASGILLHPTSLPGRYGIGDLGPAAHAWIDFLDSAGQKLWQVLPLGPTGYGDSPYQSFSALAGNPYLVSPDRLVEDGLLDAGDLAGLPDFPPRGVDFGPVIELKLRLLARAHDRHRAGASSAVAADYDRFRATHAAWLDDFALFMALKDAHGGAMWTEWAPELRGRDAAALAAARERLGLEIDAHGFRQFLFFRQWERVREHARTAGVAIVGDLPIFVAHDSVDVWANPEVFYLDDAGRRTVVAGVPPDFFTATGQLWGNPLYRWDVLADSGYAWWIERFRATLELVDVVRLDHFRGFEAYWEVPGDATTAQHGRWVPGPGNAFFAAVRAALGELPIIAEDLGVITPEVNALRDELDLPGMKVLQFAFSPDPTNTYLPHHHAPNSVVYTGTHDNDTTRGWWDSLAERERECARRYLGRDGTDVVWDLIRAAFASVAHTAIVPLQDVLDLGSEARMNLPGRPSGNWGWRFVDGDLTEARGARLRSLAHLYSR